MARLNRTEGHPRTGQTGPAALSMNAVVPGYAEGRRVQKPLTPPIDARWTGAGLHAIIGRNGQGKSTLIRIAAGLQAPLSGEVLLGEKPLRKLSASVRAEQVAFVDSTPPRGSGLTVGEALLLARPHRNEGAAREWLARLGAEDWWGARLAELSDGQAQRVMVVRAALQGTPWLVLDEPTAFLDIPAREALLRLLGEMADLGLALLLATHDIHLLAESPQLQSLHLMTPAGLHALNCRGSVKDWEKSLREAPLPQNNLQAR